MFTKNSKNDFPFSYFVILLLKLILLFTLRIKVNHKLEFL